MSDQLDTQIRRLIDDGAPPITLDELTAFDVPVRATPSSRRRMWAALAAAAVVIATVTIVIVHDDAPTRDSRVRIRPVGPTACLPSDFDHELFMRVDATAEQIDSARAALAAELGVSIVRYVDQNAAFARFSCIYADNPDLVTSVTPAALPVSFDLSIADATPALLERLRALPGVDAVSAHGVTSDCFSPAATGGCERAPEDAAAILGFPISTPSLPDGWSRVRGLLTVGPPVVNVGPQGTTMSYLMIWGPPGTDPWPDPNAASFSLLVHRPIPGTESNATCTAPPVTFAPPVTPGDQPAGDQPCGTFGPGQHKDGGATHDAGIAHWTRDGVEYLASAVGLSADQFAAILASLR